MFLILKSLLPSSKFATFATSCRATTMATTTTTSTTIMTTTTSTTATRVPRTKNPHSCAISNFYSIFYDDPIFVRSRRNEDLGEQRYFFKNDFELKLIARVDKKTDFDCQMFLPNLWHLIFMIEGRFDNFSIWQLR